MHSLILVFNGTQKSNYFICEKQKFHELFNKVLLFRARRDTLGANRFDLLLEHISFDKLSNSDSKLIIFSKRRKDKVGQSYKKNLKTVWHGIAILLKNAFPLLLVCFIFVPQVIKYI